MEGWFIMAKVSIKKIEKLEMEHPDSTIKEALFNYDAIRIFEREFGVVNEDEMLNRPYDYVSKILYSGMKVLDRSITLDEAYALIIGGGEPLMAEITKILIDNYIATATDEQKNLFVEEVKRYTEKLTVNE